MPDPALLLGPKLTKALIAFITARKGDMLDGLTLAPAFSKDTPPSSYLAAWCSEAPVHHDFAELPGSSWPQLATVEIHIKANANDAAFADAVGLWAAQLDQILATRVEGREDDPLADFSQFIADCNTGGPHHPADGLHIYSIALRTDGHGVHESRWNYSRTLEITAQNGDPET
mgnify:FL=1